MASNQIIHLNKQLLNAADLLAPEDVDIQQLVKDYKLCHHFFIETASDTEYKRFELSEKLLKKAIQKFIS